TIPEFALTDQVVALFGPPSVPRSVNTPSRQSAACRIVFPVRLEKPASQSRLLILFARLFCPPNDGKSVMLYCCGCCEATSNPQPIATSKIDNGMRKRLN